DGPEVKLEAAHAVRRAGRSPDFRREIRQGSEVVSCVRGGKRELRTGQLHAVARIAGEEDRCLRDSFKRLYRLLSTHSGEALLRGWDGGAHLPVAVESQSSRLVRSPVPPPQ